MLSHNKLDFFEIACDVKTDLTELSTFFYHEFNIHNMNNCTNKGILDDL